MNESVTHFFQIAAGLVITAMLLFLVFRMAAIGETAGSQSANELALLGTELAEAGLMQYDGTTVTGSDVRNLLKRQFQASSVEAGDLVITVSTDRAVTTHQDASRFAEVKDFSNRIYIDPCAEFLGLVERNANGIITEIHFEQQ